MKQVKIFPKILQVLLGETQVGTLTALSNEQIVFTFDENYAANKNRPTLSLSFKTIIGDLKIDPQISRVKLPPFFSNLLPEGHLREYLASRAKIHPSREFFLIQLLGEDLPGAIIVRPMGMQADYSKESTEIALTEETKDVLRFSLAGVQLKFSAIMETNGGITIPIQGYGGNWIAKVPSMKFKGVPENEFSMMTLAQMIGINIPEIHLFPTHEIRGLPNEVLTSAEKMEQTLVVKRFDRYEQGNRIHIEDMAQVFGRRPKEKYEGVSYGNIAKLLWLEAGEESLIEFIKRLVFTVAIGNADMHLKNWTIIYRDSKTPELAPAYDLVSTIAYLSDSDLALSLAGTKNTKEVDIGRFERLARKQSLPENIVVETALETAKKFRTTWKERAGDLPLPVATRERIEAHFQAITLFQQI